MVFDNQGEAIHGAAITCIDCTYVDIENSNF